VKFRIRNAALVFGAMLFSASCLLAQVPQLTPFSADMEMSSTRGDRGPRDMTGKMYVGHGAMRMEMQGEGPRQSVVITTFATRTVDILLPQQQMYIEHKAGDMPMGRRGPSPSDLKPYDPKNPCANEEGTTCKNLGPETVNGRTCDHWQITHKDGKVADVWIDQKLHFPIKTVGDGTTWELTNIKEGEPDASLFQIPAGYHKMDMGGMMQGMHPQQ